MYTLSNIEEAYKQGFKDGKLRVLSDQIRNTKKEKGNGKTVAWRYLSPMARREIVKQMSDNIIRHGQQDFK